jgi:hypothetical protein
MDEEAALYVLYCPPPIGADKGTNSFPVNGSGAGLSSDIGISVVSVMLFSRAA